MQQVDKLARKTRVIPQSPLSAGSWSTHTNTNSDSALGCHQFQVTTSDFPLKSHPSSSSAGASGSRTTEPFSWSWNGPPGLEVLLTVSAPTLTENLLFQFPINIINNIQFPFCPRWNCCYSGQKLLVSLHKMCPQHFCFKREQIWRHQLIPAVFMEEWVHIGSIFRAWNASMTEFFQLLIDMA